MLMPYELVMKDFKENMSWTVTTPNKIDIYINEFRWTKGSDKLKKTSIKDYRKYLINSHSVF